MANLSNINNVLRVSSNLRVGINTDAASYALEIGGTNSGIKLKNSGASGRVYSLLSDTSGNFQIYDDAAASGRLVISSGGNVGIGTSSPSYKLDVDSVVDGDWVTRIKNDSATGYGLYVESSSNAAQYILGLHNGSAYQFIVNGAGNVGIGITTPTLVAGKIVHIHGTAAGVHLTDTASGTASSDGGYVAFDNPNLYIQNKEAGSMFFETSGTTKLTIDSSGNATFAGKIIGQDDDSVQLELKRTSSGTDGNTSIKFVQPLGDGYLGVNSSGSLSFGTHANLVVDNKFVVDRSGNATFAGQVIVNSDIRSVVSSTSTNLGTANGGQLALYNSSNTDGNFSNIGGYNSNSLVTSQINFINVSQASRHGAMSFNTHNGTSLNEAVRIDKDGNVGIGTDSPSQSLDTTGKIRVRDGGNTTIPSIQMGASGVDGLSLPATNTIAFITNSTEKMRINSSGFLNLSDGAVTLNKSDGTYIIFNYNGSTKGYIGSARQIITGETQANMAVASTGDWVFGTEVL